MEKNVLNTDLTGKVAAVTGAGGVLCSAFAKVLARAGAKEIKHKISAAKSAASSMMIATERFVLIRIPPSKTGPARLSPSGSPTYSILLSV